MAETTFYCAIEIEILFNKERLKRKAEHTNRVENDEMSDIGRLKCIITSEKSG